MEKAPLLIDTNIFIDHLRNFNPAVKLFESIVGKEDIYFSAVTEAELLAGTENNNMEKREKLLYFLHLWNKVNVDNYIAETAGDLSRKYNLEIPDAIIVASAITNSAELITKNTKDFKKIENFKVREPY